MLKFEYNPSSNSYLLFLTIKHSFNPSLFIIPCAFRNGGYILTCLFIMIILAIMSYATLCLSQTKAVMGKDKRRYPEELTWSETITHLFHYGKILRGMSNTIETIVTAMEFLLHICKCAVYVLIAAKLIRDLTIEFFLFEVIVEGYVVVVGIPFTFVAVLSNLKHWNKILHAMATLVTISIMGGVFYLMHKDYVINPTEVDAWGEFEYFTNSIGLALFAYSYLSPICNPELRNGIVETRQYKTIAFGLVIYSTVLVTFALVCYLGLNELTETFVVTNFHGSIVSLILKCGSIVAVVLFYGQEFADAMNCLQLDFDSWENLMYFEDWEPSTSQAVVNMLGCAVSIIIALAVPSLEILCSLVGIVIVVAYNICMPLFFHIIMLMNTRPYGMKAAITLSFLLLFFSLGVYITSTIWLMFQVFTLRQYFQFT